MKNSNLLLVIILTVLITVILIAGSALIVVLATTTVDSTTTEVAGTTAEPTDGTTTAATTTTTTTTTTTKGNEPTKPATTTKPAEPDKPTTKPTTTTTKPATTPKPDVPTPAPGLHEVSGTVKGDSIDSLGIYATYTTEEIDEEAKTMKIRFTFYLQSYTLRVGARGDNKLVINGQTLSKLPTEKIELPNGSPLTRTQLYEYVVEVEKPDDNTPVHLELEYSWHFQGKYAGVPAEWLSVKVELTL